MIVSSRDMAPNPARRDGRTKAMITKSELENALAELCKLDRRSAWNGAVNAYAAELVADLPAQLPETWADVRALLLNGADDWGMYSYGGCALVYDCDIAARLCTPSQLRRVDGGRLNPNGRETWLDVQARALVEAAALVRRAWHAASPSAVVYASPSGPRVVHVGPRH